MSASLRDVPRRLSTDEFLQWLENRAEAERWELIDGEPVRSMSPETVRHVELKRNALESLRDGLRAAGPPCRAFGDGVAVRIDPRSYFQPDASVTCAEHVDPKRSRSRIRSSSSRSSRPPPECATRRSSWSTTLRSRACSTTS